MDSITPALNRLDRKHRKSFRNWLRFISKNKREKYWWNNRVKFIKKSLALEDTKNKPSKPRYPAKRKRAKSTLLNP